MNINNLKQVHIKITNTKQLYQLLIDGYIIKYCDTFIYFDKNNNLMRNESYYAKNSDINDKNFNLFTVYKKLEWFETEFKPTLCKVILTPSTPTYLTRVIVKFNEEGKFIDEDSKKWYFAKPYTQDEVNGLILQK